MAEPSTTAGDLTASSASPHPDDERRRRPRLRPPAIERPVGAAAPSDDARARRRRPARRAAIDDASRRRRDRWCEIDDSSRVGDADTPAGRSPQRSTSHRLALLRAAGGSPGGIVRRRPPRPSRCSHRPASTRRPRRGLKGYGRALRVVDIWRSACSARSAARSSLLSRAPHGARAPMRRARFDCRRAAKTTAPRRSLSAPAARRRRRGGRLKAELADGARAVFHRRMPSGARARPRDRRLGERAVEGADSTRACAGWRAQGALRQPKDGVRHCTRRCRPRGGGACAPAGACRRRLRGRARPRRRRALEGGAPRAVVGARMSAKRVAGELADRAVDVGAASKGPGRLVVCAGADGAVRGASSADDVVVRRASLRQPRDRPEGRRRRCRRRRQLRGPASSASRATRRCTSRCRRSSARRARRRRTSTSSRASPMMRATGRSHANVGLRLPRRCASRCPRGFGQRAASTLDARGDDAARRRAWRPGWSLLPPGRRARRAHAPYTRRGCSRTTRRR